MATFNLEQSKKIYQDAKSKGLDAKKVIYLMAKDGAVFDGVDMNGILSYGKQNYEPKEAPKQSVGYSDTGADIKQIGTDIANVAKNTVGNIKESIGAYKDGEQTVAETVAQTAGQVAGGISGAAGEVVKGGIKAALPQEAETAIKQGIQYGVQGAMDLTKRYEELKTTKPILAGAINLALGNAPQASLSITDMITGYQKIQQTNPRLARNLDAALGIAQLAIDIGTLGGAKVGVTAAKEGVEQGAKVAGEQIAKAGVKVAGVADNVVGKAGKTVGEIVKDTPDALARFVAPNVDPKFATALKKTTKAEVDEMESIVKKAVDNADNPSAFEVVGNKLADATEQVNNQVKSLSQQKKSIISKAKNGLNDFTKETGQAILDINRNLKDSNLAKSFITRLKQVRTKIDADNAIDELQDILYKGNKDMTIPTGSKEDRILKGIIGKYNGELKNGLPASYQKLNDAISNKLDNLDLLNKSLGEVVDGVPTRGASLIKQYFSPSGTKAKELFEFIKKNTGYDVSKDAVLAKYMSEIYGETRAKSFLQGIPTTAQGTIDKLLDFALDKTGVAGKVSDLSKKGQVLKAKSIAK